MFFKKEVPIKLGELKNLDDITIEDMKKNPVWITDLSGENSGDFDETSQRPVLEEINLTKKILKKFVTVSLLINVEGKDILGCADFEDNKTLTTVVLWDNNEWIDANKLLNENEDIIIITKVNMNGKSDLRFKYNFEKDEASLV